MTEPSIKEALELLPCPFCSKQPQSRWYGATGEDDDSGYWGIDCCQAFSHEGSKEDAVKKWNTRATFQPDGERREAIANLIDDLLQADCDFEHADSFHHDSAYKALQSARLALDIAIDNAIRSARDGGAS